MCGLDYSLVTNTSSGVREHENPDVSESPANQATAFWNHRRGKEAEELGMQITRGEIPEDGQQGNLVNNSSSFQ